MPKRISGAGGASSSAKGKKAKKVPGWVERVITKAKSFDVEKEVFVQASQNPFSQLFRLWVGGQMAGSTVYYPMKSPQWTQDSVSGRGGGSSPGKASATE